jgi:hypothetical protein
MASAVLPAGRWLQEAAEPHGPGVSTDWDNAATLDDGDDDALHKVVLVCILAAVVWCVGLVLVLVWCLRRQAAQTKAAAAAAEGARCVRLQLAADADALFAHVQHFFRVFDSLHDVVLVDLDDANALAHGEDVSNDTVASRHSAAAAASSDSDPGDTAGPPILAQQQPLRVGLHRPLHNALLSVYRMTRAQRSRLYNDGAAFFTALPSVLAQHTQSVTDTHVAHTVVKPEPEASADADAVVDHARQAALVDALNQVPP